MPWREYTPHNLHFYTLNPILCTLMSIDWSSFIKMVSQAQSFVLMSHERPDCDALGSELALAGVLTSLGKEVRIVNADPAPPHLEFIDPDRRLEVLGRGVTAESLAETDMFIVLDTSAWIQLGSMAEVFRKARGQKVVIDHHASEDEMGAVVFKDVSAEAAGCLVYEAAQALGATLSPGDASALFTAIATDTGWFRFGSVTPRVFRIAADLIAAGARPADLYQALYEKNTLARIQLLGLILSRVVVEREGRLTYTYVQQADFEKLGALPSDTEDAINRALSIRGTEVGLIFVEMPGGKCKVSLRSRGEIDVRRLAEQFGGGGHVAASGARLEGSLAEGMEKVLEAARAALR